MKLNAEKRGILDENNDLKSKLKSSQSEVASSKKIIEELKTSFD